MKKRPARPSLSDRNSHAKPPKNLTQSRKGFGEEEEISRKAAKTQRWTFEQKVVKDAKGVRELGPAFREASALGLSSLRPSTTLVSLYPLILNLCVFTAVHEILSSTPKALREILRCLCVSFSSP